VQTWLGDKPCYLIIDTADEGILVDLDQPGWLQRPEVKAAIGAPAKWILAQKSGPVPLLAMRCKEGETVRYVARHIGIASGVGLAQNEITAYGLVEDTTGRSVWLLSSGLVVTGDDLDHFAIRLLKGQ